MEYLPAVLVISGLCFVGAYGVEKRRHWAWYFGWMVALVFGGAIGVIVLSGAERLGTEVNPAGFALVTIGASAIWVSWVIWWFRHRREFGIKPRE